MSGITYYKLSEHLYPGDTTKDCGLTGAEIDANFHFLRGYDILSGKLLEDGTIVLTRLDKSEVTITGLSEYISGITGGDIDLDGTCYDPKEGILHIFVNGKEFESGITGFFTYADIHTDCSIDGDGSEENPLKIAEGILEGITAEIEEAVAAEKEERQSADNTLSRKINDEKTRAQNAENGLARSLAAEQDRAEQAEGQLARGITAERQRAEQTENQLAQGIAAERDRATQCEQTLSQQINTEANTRRQEDRELAHAIEELSQEIKTKDAVITEDVVLSPNSPLYPFLAGIWENDTVPSGTTLTEFVKKLFSADTRMIYYVNSDKIDIDDVIGDIGSYWHRAEVTSGETYISGKTGDKIVGIALPKPHVPTEIIATQFGNHNITAKFFKEPSREVILDGVVYSLYYDKINVGLGSAEIFTVKFA